MSDETNEPGEMAIKYAVGALAAFSLAEATVQQLERLGIITTEQAEQIYVDAAYAAAHTAMLPEMPEVDQFVSTRVAGLLRRRLDF